MIKDILTSATFDFTQATMSNLFIQFNMEVKSDYLLTNSVTSEACVSYLHWKKASLLSSAMHFQELQLEMTWNE